MSAAHAERFTHLRPLLFTIVYEILGSATESDDVLQDSYLRWAKVDLTTVRDTKSYLAQLVTRQALNALRAGAQIAAQFLATAANGDVDALMSMLAPDAVWIADGGGKVSAARRPVVGARKVAAAVAGLGRKGLPDMRIELATYNGAPAAVVYSGEHIDIVIAAEITHGLISALYAIRNPDKLATVTTPREIARG
jgi:hypothetical protein